MRALRDASKIPLERGRGEEDHYAEKTMESGQEPYITAGQPTIAQAARSGSALGRSKGLRGAFGLIKRSDYA